MDAGRHASGENVTGSGQQAPAQPAEVADPVEAMHRDAQARGQTLAVAVGERVRALLEEAELSGGEITRQAQQDAEALRQEALREADQIRAEATQRAREEVARASETLGAILLRLEEREDQLATMMGEVVAEVDRLRPVLALLHSHADLPAEEPEPQPEPPPAAPSGAEPDQAAVGAVAPPEPGERRADGEEARVLALNMALNGTPREEADRYLESFNVENREKLLDDFYGRPGR